MSERASGFGDTLQSGDFVPEPGPRMWPDRYWRWRAIADRMHYAGKPIREMDRDDLLAVIGHLVEESRKEAGFKDNL